MTTDTHPLAPTDSELIAELGAAGVEFMAFRGGLCGTKEVWVTAGSQDAKKIAQGVRAALAKWGAPQPVPASAAEFALRALVAAGHVTQERVDQAMALPGAPAQPVAASLTDEAARKQGGV